MECNCIIRLAHLVTDNNSPPQLIHMVLIYLAHVVDVFRLAGAVLITFLLLHNDLFCFSNRTSAEGG